MNIVIIGNGISGVTTARFIRKLSNHNITIISSETDYFFSRTALMYIYMGHMKFEHTKPYEDWFWKKNNINLKNAYINKIDYNAKKLKTTDGDEIPYDKLVLALGSASNKFGWPGQDLQGVGGLYSLQDLEQMEAFSPGLKRAVIVGGGLIGIEMAEMFHSRNIPVTFLVREKSYWDIVLPPEESEILNKHIRKNHIDLRLSTELKEIVDDGTGKACGVITNTGERIDCGYVGLTAGVHPNVNWLKDSGLHIERGIVVNAFLKTNQDDVYAIGDCAQLSNPPEGRRPIEAVWYTGKIMGETVAYNICGHNIAYDPGIWFNSAKFIDIEYQVYGNIVPNPPENHQSLFWLAPDGEKSIRITYDRNNKAVIGFNLMGIRFRHEVCERWLKDKTNIEEVLTHIELAHFNPEFYKTYESALVRQYEKETGSRIHLKKRRTLDAVISFLKS